jgi:prevent-host-death family protein
MIRSISAKLLRSHMADALNRVAYGKEHLAITRRNEVVAVLIPYEDLQELRRLRGQLAGEGTSSELEQEIDHLFEKNEKLYKALAD